VHEVERIGCFWFPPARGSTEIRERCFDRHGRAIPNDVFRSYRLGGSQVLASGNVDPFSEGVAFW
jgi:hypothetical protein